MSDASTVYRELCRLLDLLCRGDVTAEQLKRIQQLALVSRESRSFFIQYMQMHGALAWQFRETPLRLEPQNVARTSPILDFLSFTAEKGIGSQPLFKLWPLAIVVALCFWAFWGFVIQADRQQLAERPAAPRSAGAAHLQQAGAGCLWNEPAPPAVGDELAVGKTLHLEAGQLELAFASGARGLLEGPADFEIRSANGGYLGLGKLTAQVPQQAIGFSVETPTAWVVDLGTEFGVEVDSHGETGVQVFKGAVDFAPVNPAKSNQVQARAPGRRVVAGQAAQTDGAAKKVVVTHFLPGKFARQVSPQKLSRRDVPIDLRNATASQSSNFGEQGYLAQRAIDGDARTISHTMTDDSASWWQIDLGRRHFISSVVLHNELGQRGWLRDITVAVLAEDGKTVVARSPLLNPKNNRGEGDEYFDAGPLQLTFDFPRDQGQPPAGRFVRVERTPCVIDDERMITEDRRVTWLSGCRNTLVLAEVELYEPAEEP